jgi:hypothetical protein
VRRNANRAALFRDSARNRLANPPCRRSLKFKPLLRIKLIHCPQKTSIPFLN